MSDEKTNNEKPSFIIAGAHGSVGTALARGLHREGARLLLVGRDEQKLALMADQFEASFAVADVADFPAFYSCMQNWVETHGAPSGIACVAGSLFLKPAHSTTSAEFQRVLNDNLVSAFSVVQAGAKLMMKAGGSIVLTSSAAATVGFANHEALAAAKAGVEGLMRAAAASYAKRRIRVNCVAPWTLHSNMTSSLLNNDSMVHALEESNPMGKLGSPVDVSSVIQWLLSPQTSWITGQTIIVDGGLSSLRLPPKVSLN